MIFQLVLSVFVLVSLAVVSDGFGGGAMRPTMVKKEYRKSLVVSEFGEISAVDVCSGKKGDYHIEFMTLEPNALFLPVVLHADMVFYVNTGSGKLSWSEDGKEMKRENIKRGDVYRLSAGSVFFVQSDLVSERQKLRIYAIYSNTDEDFYEPSLGAYSSISDLVLGFDKKLLQSAFMASEDVIAEMTSAIRPPAIVHTIPEEKKSIFKELEDRFLNVLIGNQDGAFYDINNGKKKKKTKIFNIYEADPDFENCNGWSVTVGRGDLKSLRGSNIGLFMVNLTKGSMMGPHWNPMATEIAIVLQGQGMVKVVCSSNANETDCVNKRFMVEEGDVFAVPRFHPMAQMSFNNDSFVFMGFSTSTRRNYPQFLAGTRSVLQTLNRDVLALSFNVTNSTIHELLAPQNEAIILDCTSCAEEEQRVMVEEKEQERREEEARAKEEEHKREKERKRQQEEEEREREEEEKKRREEEEREQEKEEKKKQEEEERERMEEEEKKREEEERQAREKEEMERREREQREAEKKQEEEQQRQEEAARREQEEARRQEEERKRRQKQEEEEAARRREKEQKKEQKRQEEEAQREQEEAERQEEEERKRREEGEEEHEGGGGEKKMRISRKFWDWKL
ncbi:vicilin-like seed storage protein At2g18540 [Mercurialis annua]|uniref:vicilin-like seed storage protein At2g18540 n=1 Tax=Mercurialis annua TaxID=3986 RepID=UPI00215F48BF|nr:vicilin-like seed storage protein At2g18540 [Mercurialis annua]